MTKLIQSEHAKKLYSLINQQILFTRELIGLLEDEKEILKNRDFKNHSAVMSQKSILINQIEQTESSMKELLGCFKLEMTHNGMGIFSEHCPVSFQKILLSSWDQLMEQAKVCQTLNNTNGRIIFHSKQSIDRLLTILKGNTNNNVYECDGKANSQYESGSLAKA